MHHSLFVSDLHLTSSPRDEYRWRVFEQIAKVCSERHAHRLFILGDLTNEKDGHPATLVNRIVDSLTKALSEVPDIIILRGNHDGLDPDWPYFKFLNRIRGLRFVSAPSVERFAKKDVLMLPHSRNTHLDWRKYKAEIDSADYILMHNTVSGAVAETGVTLRSEISADIFKDSKARIYSGDVHVPQKIGNVRYVGSPYHVRFGDSFEPRMIYLNEDEHQVSIGLTNVQKVTIDALSVAEADASLAAYIGHEIHVKIRLHLKAADIGRWHQARSELAKFCKKREIEVVVLELVKHDPVSRTRISKSGSLNPLKVLDVYIAADKKIDAASATMGKELLSSCLASEK